MYDNIDNVEWYDSIYDTESTILPQTTKVNFDNFYKQSIKKSEQMEKEKEFVDITFQSPDYIFSYKIEDIPDKELLEYVDKFYSNILELLLVNNDVRYITLFQNAKFLMVLNQVLSNKREISIIDIYHLNKLIYDYNVLENKDIVIANSLQIIAKTINRTTIAKLMGLGLTEDISTEFAICRYSNSDEVICTKRLNNKIIQYSAQLMTEQMIVDIYLTLYTSMTPLFIGTMYDIYYPDDLDAIGPDAGIVNSTINLAILDLLNEMTSQDIRKVLISYAQMYRFNQNYSKVRFDIQSCTDYQRILHMVCYLESQENIVMP